MCATIALLFQADPIEELARMIIRINEADLAAESHSHKPNIHREVSAALRTTNYYSY
jgi:hypothetical protein